MEKLQVLELQENPISVVIKFQQLYCFGCKF
jgi:hypothetical protein